MWWILGTWISLGIFANAAVNGVRSYRPPESGSDERIIRTIKFAGYIVPPVILLFVLLHEGAKPFMWVFKQIANRIDWKW